MSTDPNMNMTVNELIDSITNHLKCNLILFIYKPEL